MNHATGARIVLLCFVTVLILCAAPKAQVPDTMLDQMSTADHLKQPGWWPRKGDAARDEFVGAQVCAECHKVYAAGQQQHSMAHTAMLPTNSTALKYPASFKLGPYSYHLAREGGQEIYSVSDGVDKFTTPIIWAFGSGSRGQSYLFRSQDKLYEARISFYNGRGFDITPDHPDTAPKTLQLAIGRRIERDEEEQCFGCHTVASTTSGRFEPARLMPGISCEGCHGPGASHVALANSGATLPGLIYNPARLTPVQSVDFCGACHRTWWDASLFSGIRTVRFPAFRLEKSKCWGRGEKNLTCIACHDPHQPLRHDPASYDANCLACHRPASEKTAGRSVSTSSLSTRAAAACRVSANKCVSCHMPKFTIPSMRTVFTDHKIQIVTGKDFRE